MPACVNHPYQEAQQPCADCGLPYCSACLVEFLGQQLCGPCRDLRLAQMHGQALPQEAPLAGTGRVDFEGWTAGGWHIIKDDVPTFALAFVVAIVVSMGTLLIALPAMTVGLLMMAYRKMTTGYVEFSNLFDGFRRFGNALGTFLLVSLASFGLSLALTIPVFVVAAATGEQSGATMITGLLCNLLQAVLSLLLSGAVFFAFPHVAARNASPLEALTASAAVFRRNIPMFVLLLLGWNLLSMLGFAACCIGVLITAPWVVAAQARAYADHFGLRDWEQT